MLGYGLNKAFVEGMVNMKRAKDQGLDSGVERSPQAGPATGFTVVRADSQARRT
jgi:hypothetical protein